MIGIWTDKIGLDLSYSFLSCRVMTSSPMQVSQRLGVLGVQRCVWARRRTKLLYLADVDG
jgi:hypothetical protein